MAESGLIPIDKIWEQTNGGRDIIEDLYPQSKDSFGKKKKNFRIRPDDKAPSCGVFKHETANIWFLKDNGGGDNKAKNAIMLIQEEKHLGYYDALLYIATNYCKNIDSEKIDIEIKPDIKKSEKNYSEFTYESKEFDSFELQILGKDVKVEHCKDFNCTALKWYATISKDDKPSYLICSTPDYPIYLFTYSYFNKEEKITFHKVYQPFSKDFRFLYFGKKPADYIFTDKKTAALIEKIKVNGILNSEEKLGTLNSEEKLPELFIVTGPSDAINMFAHGYRCIWFNSETMWEKLNDTDYKLLTKLSDKTYVVPDLDETGKKQTLKLCVKYLNFYIVWLPADLANFKSKGKPCKDVKDFFNIYKNERYKSNSYYFKELVRTSNPLRFWDKTEEEDSKGNSKIVLNFSAERIHLFLQANGFYKHKSIKEKKGWVFIHVKDNIVKEIPEENIADYVNNFVLTYIRNNLMYYDKMLIDKIHRSNDFKLSNLSKLPYTELDFSAFDEKSDHFFFKNSAWKITAEGIEEYKIHAYKKFVWDYKVVDFNVHKKEPLFEVNYTEKLTSLLNEQKEFKKFSEEWKTIQRKIDKLPDIEKYSLKLNNDSFSYLKYLYNTGRIHWEKEAKEELTEYEKREQDLFFISKVAALGYVMYRHKELKKAYAIFATETAMNGVGEHHGGTGKSILMQTLLWAGIRLQEYIDGQEKKLAEDNFAFEGVTSDTDYIYIEDLMKGFDLHRFMNHIQGNMTVNQKFIKKMTLQFEGSPKMMINSNHTPYRLDPSLRRRLWFIGFSDYYHAADEMSGKKEHTPAMEFDIDLVKGYKEEDKNLLYNFLAQCLQVYLKFRTKIESPIEQIMNRNILEQIGERFADWAEDFFIENNLDNLVSRNFAWDNYSKIFSEKELKTMKNDKWFKEKLEKWCMTKGYIFNPYDVIGDNNDDKKRKRIRKYEDGVWVEYFYLRAQKQDEKQEYNEQPTDFTKDELPF